MVCWKPKGVLVLAMNLVLGASHRRLGVTKPLNRSSIPSTGPEDWNHDIRLVAAHCQMFGMDARVAEPAKNAYRALNSASCLPL